MEDWGQQLLTLLTSERALNMLRAAIKVAAGFGLGRLAAAALVRVLGHGSPHQAMIVRRITFYTVLGLFLASAFVDLGFDISVLLGAAGILTVAIGFASQTSASNLISGLFLLGEKPFTVGDIIQLDTTTGIVLSIDLLSVKLRTFDNLYVRIANESLIKSKIVNISHFPIRRIDLQLGLGYGEDVARALEVLQEVAARNPRCLEEPKPLFIFKGFGDASLHLQFSVWAQREAYLDVLNALYQDIHTAFGASGITFPYPHRTLQTAPHDPFLVRIVPPEADRPSSEAVSEA
jgi:small-conductance mechanosensitive channel